jgi:hypothetical protein
MIVVFNQTSLAISKNNEAISTVPQHSSVPATLAEDVTTSFDAAPT